MCIGHFLGPDTDVGTTMTYKVRLTSAVCALTPLELDEVNAGVITKWVSFMTQLNGSFGPDADPEDFLNRDLTPEFKYYAGRVENGFEGIADGILAIPVPTPELEDNYVGASSTLPRGSGMVQGNVVTRACNNNGNDIALSNENLILDTREYAVEFKHGNEADLAANTTSQSM